MLTVVIGIAPPQAVPGAGPQSVVFVFRSRPPEINGYRRADEEMIVL